jgi:hypothetical protein
VIAIIQDANNEPAANATITIAVIITIGLISPHTSSMAAQLITALIYGMKILE